MASSRKGAWTFTRQIEDVGVDPGFEIGGCPKCVRKCAKVFFQCHVHNQVWAPWNCDTIITIGINKHEVVENYNFEAVATAANIKAFLMQEQGDCSPLNTPFSN